MKALILNSGMGSRMGVLTSQHPKCMTEVSESDTILSRQLKMLCRVGITEVVMTTGLFDDVLTEYCRKLFLPLHITFVKNPLYDKTNYIYSIYCAKDFLDDDILLLHGDLVFEESVLDKILASGESCVAVSSTVAFPEKDFKAVVRGGKVIKIGIEFFEEALSCQPLYKLLKNDAAVWLEKIEEYCRDGKVSVYAENAFNEVSHRCRLVPVDMENALCMEVDCAEDLKAVSVRLKEIETAEPIQKILYADNGYADLEAYIRLSGVKKIFLVCGNSFNKLKLALFFNGLYNRLGVEYVRFGGFTPNPHYEEVEEGVKKFRECGAQMIVAVGGGSAMDVAKCIKLYAGMPDVKPYIEQKTVSNNIPLLAVPTTSGSGSEATRYAVIYYKGAKQSVTHNSIVPQAVLLDSSVLESLPLYQKQSTLLDALCHAVESYWSVNSTEKSKAYAREAIRIILANKDAYFANTETGNTQLLTGSNLAGKAINISATTAGHAMSYNLTSLYHFAHGHAAALCVARLWPYMVQHPEKCIDPRGESYFMGVLRDLADMFGCGTAMEAAEKFSEMVKSMKFESVEPADGDIDFLADSVNPVRLKKHPVQLDRDVIGGLYRKMF